MNDATPPNTIAAEPALDEFLGTPPAKPWRKRATIAAIVVLVLIVAYALSETFGAETGERYSTAPVSRGAITVTVAATGNLAPTNQVEVGSEQSGLVTDVYVANNDRVTAGQPLARLDTSRLRDEITQAQANLAAGQAGVAQSQATLAQARANLARLEEVFRLSNGRVPSRVELDTGRAENSRAVAAVRASEAQVTQARASLSTAQTNLSKATIYSPVNGVVLSRQIEPGQTVAASLNAPVLFVIAEDLSRMKLEVRVDEADVGQVASGQRATFTVDAFPGRTFPARIERVDVGANATAQTTSTGTAATTTTASNVVAYVAALSVDNPDLILRPGMTATADIVTEEQAGQLLVPNAALRFSPEREAARGARAGQGGVTSVLVPRGGRRGGRGGAGRGEREVEIGRGSRQTVYILGEGGEPQPVQVTTGSTDGSRTAVSGGNLRPGMQVITGQLAAPE